MGCSWPSFPSFMCNKWRLDNLLWESLKQNYAIWMSGEDVANTQTYIIDICKFLSIGLMDYVMEFVHLSSFFLLWWMFIFLSIIFSQLEGTALFVEISNANESSFNLKIYTVNNLESDIDTSSIENLSEFVILETRVLKSVKLNLLIKYKLNYELCSRSEQPGCL